LSVIAAGEAGGRYGLRELIKPLEAVECCRCKGVAGWTETKCAGSRAGLLSPEMPGISELTATSGPCTTWLIGASAGSSGLNLVAPTNDNTLVEVLTCANRAPETSIRLIAQPSTLKYTSQQRLPLLRFHST